MFLLGLRGAAGQGPSLYFIYTGRCTFCGASKVNGKRWKGIRPLRRDSIFQRSAAWILNQMDKKRTSPCLVEVQGWSESNSAVNELFWEPPAHLIDAISNFGSAFLAHEPLSSIWVREILVCFFGQAIVRVPLAHWRTYLLFVNTWICCRWIYRCIRPVTHVQNWA